MEFTPTGLDGAYLIDPPTFADDRGHFRRTYDGDAFAARGLNARVAQSSVSFNRRRGTLRGMHYQISPRAEAKLVRCSSGAIYDVIVDLRPGSPTCRRWFGVELTAADGRLLYVPEGFAHGFLTLADATEVCYQISEVFSPEHARGVRWDDPAFGIAWPFAPEIIADKDRTYPDYMRTSP